jgi:hypothetical protein
LIVRNWKTIVNYDYTVYRLNKIGAIRATSGTKKMSFIIATLQNQLIVPVRQTTDGYKDVKIRG